MGLLRASRGFSLLLGYPQASVLRFFTRPPAPYPRLVQRASVLLYAPIPLVTHMPGPPDTAHSFCFIQYAPIPPFNGYTLATLFELIV